MTEASEPRGFDDLLQYLNRTRGFDFHAYKRPSLMRRIQKRMQALDVDTFLDYVDHLEVHPDEFALLFNALLINVTTFFRDEPAWAYLRDEVVPRLLAMSPATAQMRVWSAGCSSGEEAYSVAMLLAETLGRDEFRRRVRVYATDVDEHALNQARLASYSEKQVALVPEGLLDRYFLHEGDRFIFDRDLRRSIIFGRHDLVQDAPISRVCILMCRNTLMYFNTEAQGRILARFHFALAEEGVLFLGKAEMLLSNAHLFTPVDLRRRVFRKVPQMNWRDRMGLINGTRTGQAGSANHGADLLPIAFDLSPHAQVVVDGDCLLSTFNDRARRLFNLSPDDTHRPIGQLEVFRQPVDLGGLVEQAMGERRTTSLTDVRWKADGQDPRQFDVHIVPLPNGDGLPVGAMISLAETSRMRELQEQLNRSKQELDTAYEELQSTNEELETTNEELQSTVEELETTNEELQSTNEELETMNEELQSTNEELQTMNDEMRRRAEDVSTSKAFLESVLTSMRSGVIVVDRELRVVAWNQRSEDLWGLRAEEAEGQSLLSLDIGLPSEQLLGGIRVCLGGDTREAGQTIAATNRRGKSISCKVTVAPLIEADGEVHGAILTIHEQEASPQVS